MTPLITDHYLSFDINHSYKGLTPVLSLYFILASTMI